MLCNFTQAQSFYVIHGSMNIYERMSTSHVENLYSFTFKLIVPRRQAMLRQAYYGHAHS